MKMTSDSNPADLGLHTGVSECKHERRAVFDRILLLFVDDFGLDSSGFLSRGGQEMTCRILAAPFRSASVVTFSPMWRTRDYNRFARGWRQIKQTEYLENHLLGLSHPAFRRVSEVHVIRACCAKRVRLDPVVVKIVDR
jgi:hypothetical protein